VSVPDVTGEVRVFAEYDRDFTEEADVAVVGSGPCGSVVTRELQRLGKRVVLLEEGPPFTPADFRLDGANAGLRDAHHAGHLPRGRLPGELGDLPARA
jgi:choline dehydrogenase-like flavoprotein